MWLWLNLSNRDIVLSDNLYHCSLRPLCVMAGVIMIATIPVCPTIHVW